MNEISPYVEMTTKFLFHFEKISHTKTAEVSKVPNTKKVQPKLYFFYNRNQIKPLIQWNIANQHFFFISHIPSRVENHLRAFGHQIEINFINGVCRLMVIGQQHTIVEK